MDWKLRLLPIIAITLMLAGYYFTAWQLKKLENRKVSLQEDIAQLEKTKIRLINAAKERDKIITLQNQVISGSADSKTKVIETALIKELQHSTVFKTQINPSKNGLQTARNMERKGFEALLSKNTKEAIQYFMASENAYNGYNQVYEICLFLNGNQDELVSENENFWKATYKKILTDFSWKMPQDIKTELLKKSK